METMKKRGRGRPRITSFDDYTEFFKVFLPLRNSQQLKIPMSFVKKYGGIIHERSKLKGHDGKLWDVDIENTDEGVFMKNGWLNFVNYYSLQEGEFLVFKYIGNYTFTVKILGLDGVKIDALSTPSNVNNGEVKIEEESEEREVKKFCKKRSSSKQPRGSKKAPEITLVKEKHVVPENPYFVKPVNYRQIHDLIIPKEMFYVHKVSLKRDMVLRNEEGKLWPVRINKCADGRIMIGGGWVKFWKENDVQPNESCKFTFLKGESSRVIEVEILRGWAE